MLPSPALLDERPAGAVVTERELMEAARHLEEKYHQFAVAGSVTRIHPGPVVSTFEFEFATGGKGARLVGLADDLALALAVESVRVERVGGHSIVRVQLPNPHREPIAFRQVLESEAYRRSRSRLPLALGTTAEGEPFVRDLAPMPHLLVAGARGAGRSAALTAMVASILFRATADEVRLILVDPTRLELGLFEDIPHLLTPVIVDPKHAVHALAWTVREAEARKKLLADQSVLTVDRYNRNTQRNTASRGSEGRTSLPQIVVAIDGFAGVMAAAQCAFETSIARLAEVGRAVGIHLLLATGLPLEVVTDTIDRSLQARAAFRCLSKSESRAVLGRSGAEQLLDAGDMLFRRSVSSALTRVHSPFMSERETARLAAFLREQGKPAYDRSIAPDPGNPRLL